MSVKKNWKEIFASVKRREFETLQHWFREIEKATDESLSAIRTAWDRYKDEITEEKVRPTVKSKADTAPIFNINKTFESFEDGEYEIRTPYIVSGEKKILVINDIHIPYHVRSVLMLALEYTKDIDVIILNGDIVDFYACSFWDKRPDKTLLKREIEMGWNFFDGLRKMFPNAEIIFKAGNHEYRFERYIQTKAPALFGMEQFTLPEILKLKDYGMKYVSDKQVIKAGELNIIHGHEIKMGMGAINVALTLLRKANANLLSADKHITQEWTHRDINSSLHGSWVNACLCDLSPDYLPINNWNHGFALVDLFKDGNFVVSLKRITQGKVY